MNIYTKKQINCSVCGKFVGEIGVDSSVIFPLCGTCKRIEKKTNRKGIGKILVPIDVSKKSSKALDEAIYLSKNLGSSITLLKVIPKISLGNYSLVKDFLKEITKEAEKSIRWAKRYCERKHIIVSHLIAKGDEAEEIIKTAQKTKADLIILGSSGKGALKELVFGSISNFVMHNSKIPVLSVKEQSPKINSIYQTKLNKSRKRKLKRQGDGIPFSKIKQRAGLS